MSIPAQYFSNLREVRRLTVTEVSVAEGEGTVESPIRLVYYYVADSGLTLAVNDPHGVITRTNQALKEVPS